jgi:hypothetical protein
LRNRIGNGPWQNSKGVVIAKDVAELHGNNNLTKQTALTEKGRGQQRQWRYAESARHSHGIAGRWYGIPGGDDRTCKNWTSSTQGSAMLGHSDRTGTPSPTMSSWNAAHPSRGPDGGCSQKDLISTGGDGLCFAAN